MTHEPIHRRKPAGICLNCFAVWRAARPRPEAVFCHHQGGVARLVAAGWKVIEHPSDSELQAIRAKGLL